MKKSLILGVLLSITCMIILPATTNAAHTAAEAEAILNKIKVTTNKDGSCTYNTGTIPYEKLWEDNCSITYEEYVEKGVFPPEVTEEEKRQWYNDSVEACKTSMVDLTTDFSYLKLDPTQPYERIETSYDKDKKEVTLKTFYTAEYIDTENGYTYPEYPYPVTKTCKVEFAKYDEKELDKARKNANEFQEEYSLDGLNAISSIYHYNDLGTITRDNTLAMLRFPKLKQDMQKHPQYDYGFRIYGMGGTPVGGGQAGYLIIKKDGIVYDTKEVSLWFSSIFPVDKDGEGTIYERAVKRIKDYIGQDVKVEIDRTYEETLTDLIKEPANLAFGTKDVDYVAHQVMVKIGEDGRDTLLIIEVDKKLLDKYQVKANHESGITINTESPDVPSDATIEVKDVKDKEYVLKAIKELKKNILSAFDINLIKTGTGIKITTIKDGVEVYIPIKNKKVGDKLEVHHVKEDGTTGDKFIGEVVELNGQLYVKFKTTHFSTYAVVDEETNPDTLTLGENVALVLLITLVTGVAIIILSKTNVKKFEN